MRFFLHKHQKTSEDTGKGKDIYLVLLPMLLGICLCVVCLIGGTFAWFTASESTQMQAVQAASYSATVTVDGEELNSAKTLEGGVYEIEITATGSASTGYCIVNLDGFEWHTEQIPTGSVLKFKLDIKKNAVLEIYSQWGSSSMSNDDKIVGREEAYTYGEATELTSDAADVED